MTRIGSRWILKAVFDDVSVAYWAKSKNYEFAVDPTNATLFKTKKQAENKARKLESENASIYCVIPKEVKLMMIP